MYVIADVTTCMAWSFKSFYCQVTKLERQKEEEREGGEAGGRGGREVGVRHVGALMCNGLL